MLASTPTDKFLDLLVGYFRGGAGATPFVGLFMGNPALSRATLLSDLTEPTFTGYARAMPSLAAAEVDGSGNRIADYPNCTFQPSAPVSPTETVTGVFLGATLTSVDYLLFAEFLDTPKVFAEATDALDIVWQTFIRNALSYGGIAFAG